MDIQSMTIHGHARVYIERRVKAKDLIG